MRDDHVKRYLCSVVKLSNLGHSGTHFIPGLRGDTKQWKFQWMRPIRNSKLFNTIRSQHRPVTR